MNKYFIMIMIVIIITSIGVASLIDREVKSMTQRMEDKNILRQLNLFCGNLLIHSSNFLLNDDYLGYDISIIDYCNCAEERNKFIINSTLNNNNVINIPSCN